jgi:hypothetical protein
MLLETSTIINIVVGLVSFLAGHAGLLTTILGLFNRPKSQPVTLAEIENLIRQLLQNQPPVKPT